jgi:hypothetical protein
MSLPRNQICGAVILAAGVGMFAPSAASAGCATEEFHFGRGRPEITTTWTVSRNGDCVNDLYSKGTGSIDGIDILRRPVHGQAGSSSRYKFAYKPNRDYVGQDFFVARFRYEGTAGTVVLVNVNVVDRQ